MEFVEKIVNIALLRHLRNVAQDGTYQAHAVISAGDIILQLSIDKRYPTLPGCRTTCCIKTLLGNSYDILLRK
jgi:hypothetical protein